MVVSQAPMVVNQVTVGAVFFGTKPPVRGLPLQHVAQACEKLFGPDWRERLVENADM